MPTGVDKRDQRPVIVQTNCVSAAEASGIARAAVAAGLAACGNVHGPITTVYRWQGEIVEGSEWVLYLKTVMANVAALEPLIGAHHSYDLPALLVLPVEGCETRYLDWLAGESTSDPPSTTA
jgi:periplasmic divalent cation tolerance protein